MISNSTRRPLLGAAAQIENVEVEVSQTEKCQVGEVGEYQIGEDQVGEFQVGEGPVQPPEVLLSDISDVGSGKHLGYLPVRTINEIGVDPNALKDISEKRGMKAVFLSDGEVTSLYVFDPVGLQNFLDSDSNTQTLKKNNWPASALEFVRKVHDEYAADPELYSLVARAFNDVRFR